MDSTILYSLITFASATIALIVKYSYQSKCRTIKCCCGLIDIERATEVEEKETEFIINHRPIPESPSNKSLSI